MLPLELFAWDINAILDGLRQRQIPGFLLKVHTLSYTHTQPNVADTMKYTTSGANKN